MSRVPTIKFLQRIKSATKRNIVYQVTNEVWNTPDCSHFEHVTVKNPNHTSHVDPAKHATVRMATAAQLARGAGQTVHIYYNEQTGAYTDTSSTLNDQTGRKTFQKLESIYDGRVVLESAIPRDIQGGAFAK